MTRVLVVALAAMAVVFSAPPSAGAVKRSDTSAKCSYFEAGEYTGADNRRVSVTPRHVSCGAAITITREFRSFLPKRHHGPTGDAGWWTVPANPGWRCRKQADEGSCRRGSATSAFEATELSNPARCRNEVPAPGHLGGALFISWRHVGCGARRRIASSLLHGSGRDRVTGFVCQRLELRAGGGGEFCHEGGRFLEVGFE
jgi:hypothetical protein